MKYLTRGFIREYNKCRSGHQIALTSTDLFTNPIVLRFYGLASRFARLLRVVWLSCLIDSSIPPYLKVNESCRQADYARALLLHCTLPLGRSLGKSKTKYLYGNFKSKYSSLLRKAVLFIVLVLISFSANAFNCTGRFPNPVTDVCWECLFPITIGEIPLAIGTQPDTRNPISPICACPTPFPRIGISAGFWEPVRLVDVTKRPFCFVNLGGMTIAPGLSLGAGKAPGDNDTDDAVWHVHWYVYPLLYWLNLITDFACLEQSGFDVAYITELDPLWHDDELAFLINPEAVLFANPIAQAACAADCVASTVYLPLDSLFWCAGCQGGMYPMNGKVQAHVGSIQSSLLATEKMAYKLHRELLLWGTSGELALCQPYPMPVIKKSQYRSQVINPIPSTLIGVCAPFGNSTILYEPGKEIPVIGEDFGYLIWRKRNCCVF